MALSASAMREWRGAMIAVVFQDALLALAPHLTIGRQLTEVLTAHQPQIGRAAARQAALESLQDVQLSDPVRCLSQYPHELSGGMLQRVMIAMALIGKPQLLILDEPTSALDALVRQDIIRLLQRLRDRGIRLLCITHDVAVAARLGDELAVMLGGQLVETGATADILKAPQHPYTRALLASQITLATTRHGNIPTMPEAEPVNAPGCVFASRCHSAVTTCQATPALRWIGSRQVRCHQPWLGLD
jgi:oligopeptide/dipeptide ABC transporter ATP-binding protein